jgi:hypothetical protein
VSLTERPQVVVELFDKTGIKVGTFASQEEAVLAVPQVTGWVDDQEHHSGLSGWLPGASPVSAPDYRIRSA